MKKLISLLVSGVLAIAGCYSNQNSLQLSPIKDYKYVLNEQGEVTNYPFIIGEVIYDSIKIFEGEYKDSLIVGGLFGVPGVSSSKQARASYFVEVNANIDDKPRKLRFEDFGSVERLKNLEERINPGDKIKITFSPATPTYFREIEKINNAK